MKIASVSEAKAKLSALLDLVKAGETVTVTERGIPVARLVPVTGNDAGDDEARLQRLERAGVIRRGRGGKSEILLKPGPRIDGVLEALLEERRTGR